jgi:predicted urease superfamily metal-dependent hydrolase
MIMDDAQKLYELILETANKFLRNARMFEMHVLRDHNPTYEELAKIMHQVSTVIFELADDVDPMLSQKAADYAFIMKRMGKAITDNDDKLLEELAEELDKKPFL